MALGLKVSCYVGVNKASLGKIVFCTKSWADHLELWSRRDLRGLQAASMEFTSFALPKLTALDSGLITSSACFAYLYLHAILRHEQSAL